MLLFLIRSICKIVLILSLFIILFAQVLVNAQTNIEAPKSKLNKIKIATKSAPPLVIIKGNELTGFSIDLWRELSKRLNVEGDFVVKENVKSLLDSVIEYENQIGLAAISQTAEREKVVDFSQPYLSAGLQVVVRANEASIYQQVINFLQSNAMKLLYFGIFVIILMAHLHLFYKKIRGITTENKYLEDIWDSIWWLFNGFFRTEFGDHSHRLHQIVSALMIIISIIFITQFQAMVTADLTTDILDSKISSLEDIKSKNLGTVKGTTAEKFGKDNQLKTKLFANNDELFEGLLQFEVEAIIVDAPIAKYFVTHDGKNKAKESILLNKEHYSIAFPIGSTLRKEFNQKILEIEQDGTMADLTKKWFGEN
jgi:polar amino acid transport system substrate-binding protein